MINNIVLTGRLARDCELRYTSQGTAIGTVTLAVNRRFKNAEGATEADFPRLQLWRKTAENFASFTKKGSLVGIEGRLQTGSYEKDGRTIYTTDIIVENFTLLETRTERENNAGSDFNNNSNQTYANNQSSAQTHQTKKDDPFLSSGQTIDISDDDLPF